MLEKQYEEKTVVSHFCKTLGTHKTLNAGNMYAFI